MINKFDCKNIDLFKLQKGSNDLNEIQIKSNDKIKENINNKKGIYICSFRFWNYNIIKIVFDFRYFKRRLGVRKEWKKFVS